MLHEDARALSTLVSIHWTRGRWRPRNEPFYAPPEDIAHAVAAGYLFADRQVGHDRLVEEITFLSAALSLADAGRSFIASLSDRHLFLRPFLPSLVVARGLRRHEFMPGRYHQLCATCGLRERLTIDRDALNFERHKWGGVRLLALGFTWFCLDRLAAEGGATPTDKDYGQLDAMLDALRNLPPRTTATRAEVALRGLKSNKAERLVVIEALSIAGVLVDRSHPGFLEGFVLHDDREHSARTAQRGYPAEWWTSDCGVNEDAVQMLFPRPSV